MLTKLDIMSDFYGLGEKCFATSALHPALPYSKISVHYCQNGVQIWGGVTSPPRALFTKTFHFILPKVIGSLSPVLFEVPSSKIGLFLPLLTKCLLSKRMLGFIP